MLLLYEVTCLLFSFYLILANISVSAIFLSIFSHSKAHQIEVLSLSSSAFLISREVEFTLFKKICDSDLLISYCLTPFGKMSFSQCPFDAFLDRRIMVDSCIRFLL